MLHAFVIALLFQQTASSVPAPQKLWEATLSSRILSLAVARGGACIGVLTESDAEVRDEMGRRTWASPIVGDRKDIAFGRIAVSPQCDWTAVFISRNTRPPMLQIFGRNGNRTSISLDAMVGLDPNAANISSLSISPDGKLGAVGFESGRLWVVSRSGSIQKRLGPMMAPQIDVEFASDSKRLVMKGWFATGLLNLDGDWLWESKARNLVASRNLSLFATLTAPMHGPQGGEIAILDAHGSQIWQQTAWNAGMAIAPDGSFVAFSTTPEKSQQPATPPFPVVPDLSDTPEVRLMDKTGKLLAQSAFNGALVGISDDRCILLRLTPNHDFLGVNRQLVGVWRLPKAWELRYEGSLIVEHEGNKIRASRMPACK